MRERERERERETGVERGMEGRVCVCGGGGGVREGVATTKNDWQSPGLSNDLRALPRTSRVHGGRQTWQGSSSNNNYDIHSPPHLFYSQVGRYYLTTGTCQSECLICHSGFRRRSTSFCPCIDITRPSVRSVSHQCWVSGIQTTRVQTWKRRPTRKVNMVLNVHIRLTGDGEKWKERRMKVVGVGRDYIPLATLSPSEWLLHYEGQPWQPFHCFIHCEGQGHKTVSTDRNFWRERKTEQT